MWNELLIKCYEIFWCSELGLDWRKSPKTMEIHLVILYKEDCNSMHVCFSNKPANRIFGTEIVLESHHLCEPTDPSIWKSDNTETFYVMCDMIETYVCDIPTDTMFTLAEGQIRWNAKLTNILKQHWQEHISGGLIK
jgi:hypothetical protein